MARQYISPTKAMEGSLCARGRPLAFHIWQQGPNKRLSCTCQKASHPEINISQQSPSQPRQPVRGGLLPLTPIPIRTHGSTVNSVVGTSRPATGREPMTSPDAGLPRPAWPGGQTGVGARIRSTVSFCRSIHRHCESRVARHFWWERPCFLCCRSHSMSRAKEMRPLLLPQMDGHEPLADPA